MTALQENASSRNGLTALAGGGQTGATLLDRTINRVTTVATAADSVMLPKAVNGKIVFVVNAAAANAMAVFPFSADSINALAVNASLSVAANKGVCFVCPVDGIWQSILSA